MTSRKETCIIFYSPASASWLFRWLYLDFNYYESSLPNEVNDKPFQLVKFSICKKKDHEDVHSKTEIEIGVCIL